MSDLDENAENRRAHAQRILELAALALEASRHAIPVLEALLGEAEAYRQSPEDHGAVAVSFDRADTLVAECVLALGSIHDHLTVLSSDNPGLGVIGDDMGEDGEYEDGDYQEE